MRKLLVVALVLVPVTVLALGKAEVPPVHKWAEAPAMSRSGDVPPVPTNAQFQVVRIDTMISYIRFLFEHKQAEILPDGTDNWFYFAYNDNWSHIRTTIFDENDMGDPTQWIVTDITEWTGEGTLRYPCLSSYNDGAAWYPQVVWNAYGPSAEFYQIDEGGLGVGLWTPEISVTGPTYDYYLPLIDTGPDNVVYMDGQARDTANDSHVFKSFDGWTGADIAPEFVVGPDTVWNGQGYENSQLVYGDGMIVVAAGAFRTAEYSLAYDNPLLAVYRMSTDDGLTWSDNVWLDQAVVPDMPGSVPGIDGHYYNSFFDLLIDDDGDLHFMVAIVDSGYWDNTSEHFGFYDVHQDNGTWTASQITDGVYGAWDPRTEFLDGDSWMHAPSLALHPDGNLCAAWTDAGYVDWADTTLWFDIFYSWSADGGNTWHEPVQISETGRSDTYFPRLIPTTTDDYAYVLTMYDFDNSPLDMYVVPWNVVVGADDPAVSRPSLASLSTKPNPFKDDVAVSLSLASPGMVEASVYNARGEVVETLARGTMPAGAHSLVWNAGDAPAGVYFCRVKAGEERLSARMVLVR